MSSDYVEILDSSSFTRTLTRIAHEIVERNSDLEELALVGILTRGAPLASKLGALIEKISGVAVPVGSIDITRYRDDLTKKEKTDRLSEMEHHLGFSVHEKNIVMVDDVIFKGRTARAAMEALIDLGRPKRISLAVMVDRGHRELPIRADYVGKNVPTSLDENVKVLVEEIDSENRILLYKSADRS